MELESVTLREISQSEKGKYHMISLIRGTEEINKQRGGGG